jgi:hypothetical protein
VNLNPCFSSALNDGDNLSCLYDVGDGSASRSIAIIGTSSSHMILPCESVGGPGRSNLLAFLTGCCAGQYSMTHLVHR